MSREYPDPDAGDDEQPELGFAGIQREADDRDRAAASSGPPRAAGRPERSAEPRRSEFFRAKRAPLLPVIGLVGAVATVAFFLWLGRDDGPPPAAAPVEELAPVAAAPAFEVPFPEALESPPGGAPGPGSLAAAAEPDPSLAPPAPSQGGAQVAALSTPAAARERKPEPATAVRNAFSVQLLAARSEADVGASWEKLRGAHPDLLASLSPTVARMDRGPGDTFYRLRAGPLRDRTSAEALCKALSARDQSCFVVSPGS
jgi:cell division septation protein DedD